MNPERRGVESRPRDVAVKPLHKIPGAEVIRLPDAEDHINWLEVGPDRGTRTRECLVVSYKEGCGHYSQRAWITVEELEKARRGEGFVWFGLGSPRMEDG